MHRKPHPDDQNRGVQKARQDGRDHAKVAVQFLIAVVLRVHRSLVPCPAFKITVLRAAGLDRFNHLHGRGRRRRQLCLVTHHHTRNIDTAFGDQVCGQDLKQDRHHSDQRQKPGIADHDDEIEHHHHRVHRHGRDCRHDFFRDPRIRALARLDIASHALAEEFHREPKDLPHVGGVARYGHLSAQREGVNCLDPGRCQLQKCYCAESDEKRSKPGGFLSCQHPVKEDTGKRSVRNADQRADYRAQEDKPQSVLGAAETATDKVSHALRRPARLEAFPGHHLQGDPGEALIEGLHRHAVVSAGRVVQIDLVPAEPVADDEMVEVPVDDAGKDPILTQRLGFVAVGADLHAVVFRRRHDVGGVAAVP